MGTATKHFCFSCDFCLANDREVEEALCPVAISAQPSHESPASRKPVRMGLIAVDDASEAIRRQEAQFDTLRVY